MICWVQISSGRGPAECAWVVERLVDVLSREARSAGITVDRVHPPADQDASGARSVVLALEGPEAKILGRSWSGTVQWVGTSPLRPHHRRRNWFVGVDVFRPADRGASPPKPDEVRFEVCRSSGPGGQHVNRRSTAVRAIHLPSGISVRVERSRSQRQNRQSALERLGVRLAAQQAEEQRVAAKSLWRRHDALERGRAVRVYRGPSFLRSR